MNRLIISLAVLIVLVQLSSSQVLKQSIFPSALTNSPACSCLQNSPCSCLQNPPCSCLQNSPCSCSQNSPCSCLQNTPCSFLQNTQCSCQAPTTVIITDSTPEVCQNLANTIELMIVSNLLEKKLGNEIPLSEVNPILKKIINSNSCFGKTIPAVPVSGVLNSFGCSCNTTPCSCNTAPCSCNTAPCSCNSPCNCNSPCGCNSSPCSYNIPSIYNNACNCNSPCGCNSSPCNCNPLYDCGCDSYYTSPVAPILTPSVQYSSYPLSYAPSYEVVTSYLPSAGCIAPQEYCPCSSCQNYGPVGVDCASFGNLMDFFVGNECGCGCNEPCSCDPYNCGCDPYSCSCNYGCGCEF